MSANQQLKPIQFSRVVGKDFSTTLKQRVNSYFVENNISRFSNSGMVFKTIFMLSLYFIPYGLIVSGLFSSSWMMVLLYTVMAFGVAGIGLSIQHDANHGAYSTNANVNKYLGKMLNVIGGFASAWKIQHNVLHHTYTNILHYDEDISPIGGVLRFSPNDELNKIHKFQHIYAWFLYGLMTFMWVTTKDFKQIYRYKEMGLTNTLNQSFNSVIMELIISKILYYGYILVIPLMVTSAPWWSIVLGICVMHYVASLMFGLTFQPGHIVPETNFPQPTRDLTIENNWMIHQLESTSNYAPNNRLFSWFVGGINFQVEHHLFPNICHVHYRALSQIISETAKEYDVPYYSHSSFLSALKYHAKMLKSLGEETKTKAAA